MQYSQKCTHNICIICIICFFCNYSTTAVHSVKCQINQNQNLVCICITELGYLCHKMKKKLERGNENSTALIILIFLIKQLNIIHQIQPLCPIKKQMLLSFFLFCEETREMCVFSSKQVTSGSISLTEKTLLRLRR